MATYLLLDGYNLAFRAFYAMPETLTRSDGLPTGAVHGWVRTLWWLEDNQRADCAVTFFDLGGASRHEALLTDYKANRTAMPDAMRLQMPYMKRLSTLMGFGAIEREGVEADDLIATWCRLLTAQGHTVKIVSADKDLGQCLHLSGVRQLLPPPTSNPKLGWRELDAAGVEEKFGVPPRCVPDFLALVGDTSDNIPGLDGVGPKTAAKCCTVCDRSVSSTKAATEAGSFQRCHEGRDLLRRT
jgi:DNA polymerase-1